MFKVNNKITRTTSLTYCTYSTLFSGVAIVDFEQINLYWIINSLYVITDNSVKKVCVRDSSQNVKNVIFINFASLIIEYGALLI